jgi:hypothetical protein
LIGSLYVFQRSSRLNDLPESQHTLRTAIDIGRKFDRILATVSLLGDPSAYTSFAILIEPVAVRNAFIQSYLRSFLKPLALLMFVTDITYW